MNTLTENAAPSRSRIAKILVRPFAYRHPRVCASAEGVIGLWLVTLGAGLCWHGYWWGASLWVVAALPFWISYQILQPSVRS